MVAVLCLTGGLPGAGKGVSPQAESLHSVGSLITDQQTGFGGRRESVVTRSWTDGGIRRPLGMRSDSAEGRRVSHVGAGCE